jgi:uncharacterized protein YfbU (UPF0304 family)
MNSTTNSSNLNILKMHFYLSLFPRQKKKKKKITQHRHTLRCHNNARSTEVLFHNRILNSKYWHVQNTACEDAENAPLSLADSVNY